MKHNCIEIPPTLEMKQTCIEIPQTIKMKYNCIEIPPTIEMKYNCIEIPTTIEMKYNCIEIPPTLETKRLSPRQWTDLKAKLCRNSTNVMNKATLTRRTFLVNSDPFSCGDTCLPLG